MNARAARLVAAVLVASASAGAASAGADAAVPRTWPFSPPGELRSVHRGDALPDLYADRRRCSKGCRAPGAVSGWPVRPFNRPHPLRAGLNELRPGNLHLGVDILARDGTAVYAMQPGRAEVIASTGRDARVRVGNFEYWHIRPRVADGQVVRPYSDALGTVLPGAAHVHVSELGNDGRYLNPLRPGGRVLSPWRDTAAPVIGRPRFRRGGRVTIRGFDPVVRRGPRASSTPVLGLAGLAYRLTPDRGGRGRLRWAFRGTQHLPSRLRRSIYARGSKPADAKCAALRRPCRPNWVYRVAGGLAPRLRVRPRRAYRLTVYAFDWAGHRRAIGTRVVFVRGEAFIAPPR